MQVRTLGRSGLRVSVLGFGVMTFGEGKGPFKTVGSTQSEAARRQVAMAIDAGVTLFDTADVYSRGASEEILAQALGGKRPEVLIATKVFGAMGKGDHDLGLSRQHLIHACNASLKRLNSDWIDLYQVHNFDSLVPLEETLRALDDLVRCGKVRYLGCSNHFAWQLTKALGVADRAGLTRYVSQQIQYSLLVRDAESELLPAGLDLGVGSVIWGPLAGGYLSAKFLDPVHEASRVVGAGLLERYDTERGRAIARLLRDIAAAHAGATPSQVALNWLLQRPGVSSVLVGARTEQQLADNLAAAQWSLAASEVEALDQASRMPVNYPESSQRLFHPERNPSWFRKPPAR